MKDGQQALVPPAPTANVEHDFYQGAVRISARLDVYGCFSVYRKRAKPPGPNPSKQEVIGVFLDWPSAFRCGERAARSEEQREVDAGYDALQRSLRRTK